MGVETTKERKTMTNLGARILREKEIELILPNIKDVYKEIDRFREEVQNEVVNQKINNIGIMGNRGTGKTSVLKTIYATIDKNKNKNGDVLLPIIVPENMSECATLMDVILGSFKCIVEQRKQQYSKRKYGDCIYSEDIGLDKAYNGLVQQYCYIKKDYRDILIQQFSTEQYYINESKKVFNSDTRFIEKFREFLKELLPDDDGSNVTPMLFIFIDDIDLSTRRCVDITRTLLSYLSDQRIITFISGDEETYGESLTLDFLRQEDILNSVINSSKEESLQLWKNKKKLAYEYLKKIIPPANRYYVKRWSLEERGKFFIYNPNIEKQITLSNLLSKLCKGKEGIFNFGEEGTQGNQCSDRRVFYHIFDDTSRGLNNIYNLLSEYDSDEEIDYLVYIKRVLDTLVASKQQFNIYQRAITENIVHIFPGEASIDFSNAKDLINNIGEENPVDCFAMFLLIELIRQLLCIDATHNEDYLGLKRSMLQRYINDETIDERIASSKLEISLEKEAISSAGVCLWNTLVSILEKINITFALNLIQEVKRQKISEFYDDYKNRKFLYNYKKEVADCFYILKSIVASIENMSNNLEEKKKYLTDIFRTCKVEMQYLLRYSSANFNTIFGEEIFNEYMPDTGAGIYGVRFLNASTNDIIDILFNNILSIDYDKLSYFEIKQVIYNYYLWDKLIENVVDSDQRNEFQSVLIRNIAILLQRGLASSVMQELADCRENQYQVKPLPEKNENEEKVLQILYQVDKQELWKEKYVKEKIGENIQDRVSNYLEKVSKQPIFFDITDLCGDNNVRTNFMKCNDGETYTYAKRAKDQFRKMWSIGVSFVNYKERTYICLMDLFILIEILDVFLYRHSTAWYGREQARALRDKLHDMPAVLWKEQEVSNEILHIYDQKMSTFINEFGKKKSEHSGIMPDIELGQQEAYNYEKMLKSIDVNYKQLDKNRKYEYIVWKVWNSYNKKEKEKPKSVVLWDDYVKYIFHSYLRYQQETNTKYEEMGKIAGILSESASQFVEAEENAISQEKNRVIANLQEHIDISEDEFEKIFG